MTDLPAWAATPPSSKAQLIAWTLVQAFAVTSATRNANGAITTAQIAWPDGATGTFTADILSSAFPGAVDAFHVTYVYNPGTGNVTRTVTQAAVTRNPNGAVIAQPIPLVT